MQQSVYIKFSSSIVYFVKNINNHNDNDFIELYFV